jgi:hypothetical protein
VAAPPIGFSDHYVLIAHYKSQNGVDTWRSEFTIQGAAGTVPQPGDPIITAAEGYFTANLMDPSTLVRLELRAWSFGPQPFSARGALWEKPLNLGGTKTIDYGGIGTLAVGKEVVAFIKFSTNIGKQGKQFLRQLFDNQDVGAQSGGPWVILPPPATPRVTVAKFKTVALATIGPFINSATPTFVVVHFSKKQYLANPGNPTLPFSSPILSVDLVGPSVNKATRRNKR